MKNLPGLSGLRASNLRTAPVVAPLVFAAILVSLWLLTPARTPDYGAPAVTGTSDRLTPSHFQRQPSISRIQSLLLRIEEGSSATEGLVKELLGTPSAYASLTVSALIDQLARQPAGSGSLQSLFGRGIGPFPDSCAHRSEHSAYPWPPLAASPTFEKIAAAYESFHARCTTVGGNISQLVSSGATPPCKYIVYTVTRISNGGLGNQLLSLVSTLLYGMLTARVILVHEKSLPAELLCEPFRGSSWRFPNAAMRVPSDDHPGDVSDLPCGAGGSDPWLGVWNQTIGKSDFVFMDVKHCSPGRPVLFSDAALEELEAADWLAVYSNQYFLPALYHQRRFLPLLREMFPDNRPGARLMRHFFHPIDTVWQHVKREYAENMADRGYRIGAQLRFFQQPVDVDSFLKRLIRCGHTTGKLPRLDELTDNREANIRLVNGLTNRSVFVGTLEAGVKTGVHSVYGTSGSEHVRFHVFESNNDTREDYGVRDHKKMALVDIWLMSYVQTLIVSPESTFGQSAMALGNTETWVLDREPLDGCSKARAREPCYQHLPGAYDYQLAEKEESYGRLGFLRPLSGVVSMCNDQYGGLTFVNT